jgi:hypothetical protein
MRKINIAKKLISLANHLKSKGLIKEADTVGNFAFKLNNDDPFGISDIGGNDDPPENDDDGGGDGGSDFLGRFIAKAKSLGYEEDFDDQDQMIVLEKFYETKNIAKEILDHYHIDIAIDPYDKSVGFGLKFFGQDEGDDIFVDAGYLSVFTPIDSEESLKYMVDVLMTLESNLKVIDIEEAYGELEKAEASGSSNIINFFFRDLNDNLSNKADDGEVKKDKCYHKVKSRYKKWPSAYASGALVKCRRDGAENWGEGGSKKKKKK